MRESPVRRGLATGLTRPDNLPACNRAVFTIIITMIYPHTLCIILRLTLRALRAADSFAFRAFILLLPGIVSMCACDNLHLLAVVRDIYDN